MARKTKNPKLIAMLDKAEKTADECERWYGRMRRAFNRLEKTRRALSRLRKRIQAMENQTEPAA